MCLVLRFLLRNGDIWKVDTFIIYSILKRSHLHLVNKTIFIGHVAIKVYIYPLKKTFTQFNVQNRIESQDKSKLHQNDEGIDDIRTTIE